MPHYSYHELPPVSMLFGLRLTATPVGQVKGQLLYMLSSMPRLKYLENLITG